MASTSNMVEGEGEGEGEEAVSAHLSRYRNTGPIMDAHDSASHRYVCNIGACGLPKALAWFRSNEELSSPGLRRFVLPGGTTSRLVREGGFEHAGKDRQEPTQDTSPLR